MSDKLSLFQSQFYKNEELVHFNNAGLQPITKNAFEKLNYWSKRFFEEGFNVDKDYAKDIQYTRESLAKMIGCTSKEVAFFTSTAGAVNQLAFSIGLKPGDEVIMWDQEYASHLYPWKTACDQAKAKLVVIESEKYLATPTEKYLAAITEKTKVIAFSWVQFASGAQMADIEHVIKVAKQKGIFVFVDIIQGFGLFECQIWQWGADAVVGGSHKWLFSPIGVGFLAVREKLISQLKPHVIGALTYGTCDDPADLFCSAKSDATRFEPGSKQVWEITALSAALDLIQQVGVKTIETEALRLAKILRDGLIEKNYEVISPFPDKKMHSTPFINFKPKNQKTIQEVSQLLNQHKIFHAIRGPGIRFTTQAFNTEEQIKKALEVLF